MSKDPKGRDVVTPALECTGGIPHEWDSLGNAKYRCSECGVFGYRRQIVQAMRSRPTDRQGMSLRYCEKTIKGERCRKPAVGRDSNTAGRLKSWRCPDHRLE